jgi:regulator of sigma E protease
MSIAVAIAGLVFLIIIHEAGHFFVARAVGMRPRKFYIFFPPAIFKRVRNGIEYGIGAIPLGGYVKIPGMHRPAGGDLRAHLQPAVEEAPWLDGHVTRAAEPLDAMRYDDARVALADLRAAVGRADLTEAVANAADRGLTDIEDGLSGDAYWRATTWKRVAVIFAGPGVNLIFAIGLLAAVFALGVPMANTVESVEPGTPAVEAGLRPGDRIVAINGDEVTPVLTDRVASHIRGSEAEPVQLTIERDGRRIDLPTVETEKLDGIWRLGFVLQQTEESFGPVQSMKYAFLETWAVTEATGSAIARLVTGSSRDEISSPVGIVQGSSDALEIDYRIYLRILALISLSLALLNLLPLLPLDGGHIAFSLLEGARGRAIPRVAYERASAIGIALVLLLFFLGVTNDVNRLNGG